MNNTLITPAGLARLNEELERLKTVDRDEIAERLRHALAGEANAVESGDYQGAREEQVLLERRIALLEDRIASAAVVEPGDANGLADVGERIRLRDLDSGARFEIELVGQFEADPFAARVSIASPIGRALLGLSRGEVAVVDAPKGRRRLKVLAVEEQRRADAA